mgnify:CR=1 FL=1
MSPMTTNMLIMELRSRMDLQASEPDPRFDIALNDLEKANVEAFDALHKALHDAYRTLTKCSIYRTSESVVTHVGEELDARL